MQRNDITYQEKLNELRLDMLHPKSRKVNFILLEGDSDVRLFRKFFNLDKCKVENVPGGNVKLEECVADLMSFHFLVIGIRDADFIKIVNPQYAKQNMFLTDQHDIEMTMLHFEKVLSALVFEYSAKPKDEHTTLKNQLIETILSLSCLKLLNEQEDLELNFSAGFQDLLSFATLNFDLEQYITRTIGKSPSATITDSQTLIQKVNTIRATNPETSQITNGHDLLSVFAAYFKEIGSSKSVTGEQLATAIRMVFTKEMFEETELYAKLNEWQEANGTQLFGQ
jgi:hypothetical protein